MNILKKKIHNLINENGPISLAKFMEISLGDEKYGYYTKKMPLGSGGDFVTCPDISQIFGEIIGIWILDIWIKLNKPKNFQIFDKFSQKCIFQVLYAPNLLFWMTLGA